MEIEDRGELRAKETIFSIVPRTSPPLFARSTCQPEPKYNDDNDFDEHNQTHVPTPRLECLFFFL